MPRMTLPRFPRLAALLAATVLGLALAATASADTPPGRGPGGSPAPTPSPTPPAGDCAVLRVQLNGARPAAHSCLAHAPVGPGADAPSPAGIGTGDCRWGDLVLYQNRNFGGAKICFTGAGTVNLRNYPIFAWPPGTWSDRVSSVHTNDWALYLYEHADTGGARRLLAWRTSYADLGSFWNDRASSICVPGRDWTCP